MDSKLKYDRIGSEIGSKPSRKVRVVAKVRGVSTPEAEVQDGSSRWISVKKPQGENSENVAISFGVGQQTDSRKECYLVDYCYEQNEETELIYLREVKPLVSAVFEGHNSTVIAYGARGSGKTHVIQGSADKPGITMLAISEFLSMVEQNGKSISISLYEVDHLEHAVDLLNPEQPTIMVLEDRGRIQLKGLSQIPVKSISEFQKLYFNACVARKAALKKANERPRRSHIGLIVHVFSHNESTDTVSVGKMNFVDLAGYEDARRKSSDCSSIVETNKINKSIYALLKVCHALNTNESRIPYRECKLTRMLQDSLRGSGKILMVACLNPSFCPDTIYMVSLVSRSFQEIHQPSLDATKKYENLARKMTSTSNKSQTPKNVSTTAKKLAGSKLHVYEKEVAGVKKSAMKARKLKLFADANRSTVAEKAMSLSDRGSTFETSKLEEGQENSVVPVTNLSVDHLLLDAVNLLDTSPRVEKDHLLLDAVNLLDTSPRLEKTDSLSDASGQVELYPIVNKDVPEESEDHQKEFTPVADSDMNKENNSLLPNENGSPPISAQLRELSNNLKSLLSSTPLCAKMPEEECISLDDQVLADNAEPETPVIEKSARVNDRWDVKNVTSPWEALSMHNSGMKKTFEDKYVRFLNTAEKEDLKKLKGIGEKRAAYIIELREESPEPFKSLDDLKEIGLSAKQIKRMMKDEVGELFN